MLRFLILAALMLPAATAQTGQFLLFNSGRPMPVKVDHYIVELAGIGVDRAKIQAAVADRLRSVGLWTASETESGGAYLIVSVSRIGENRFAASCRFHKVYRDEFGNSHTMNLLSGDYNFFKSAAHNGDAAYVEFITLRVVDEFVDAYKRVNGL